MSTRSDGDVPSTPADRHLCLDGAPIDHVEWDAGPVQDDFDAAAMEAAILEARLRTFRVLADLDAA